VRARPCLSLALVLLSRVAGAQPPAPVTPPSVFAAESARVPGLPGDDAWAARDLALSEVDALHGGVGLLHTQHAESGAPGQLRMAFTTETFGSGFLCTTKFPCPNPSGGQPLTHDSLTHLGGTLNIGVTITRWLDAYAVTGAYGDSDGANHPSLLQVLGDSQLGLRLVHPFSKVLHAATLAELDLVNGSGAVGLAGGGTGAKFGLLGTMDLRGMTDPFPLRVSLDTTYVVDDTAAVVQSYESALGAPVTRVERFGLQINRVDHLDVGLGAETFLADDRVRPFLEYALLAPINRQGYECPVVNASSDGCLADHRVVPSTVTFGSRFYPWKHGFSLTAALDVGVTGVKNFIEEVAPTAPWTLYLGAGWAVDTWERPAIEKTEVVDRIIGPKPEGNLRGLVHVKDATTSIPDAILAWEDHPELTSRASGSDGRFSIPVDPGTYKLVVRANGYRDGACGGVMGPRPVDVEIDCPLEPALVQVTANEITIQQQIQFEVDSANILPESDGLMREIADTLAKNPRIHRVEVQGHTDSSGALDYNQKLSEQRAVAVRGWLVAHGVASERLVAHGYGEERPLIPNVTKGMKAKNRRVQFIILEQTLEKGTDR